MLDSVKIARRQSEIRQNLSTLVGKADATADEIRNMEAMDSEYRLNEIASARRSLPKIRNGVTPAQSWKPARVANGTN